MTTKIQDLDKLLEGGTLFNTLVYFAMLAGLASQGFDGSMDGGRLARRAKTLFVEYQEHMKEVSEK